MPKAKTSEPGGRALAELKGEAEHFAGTIKTSRRAPKKRDTAAPIPKRKKGVTKPKASPKKTKDQKAEEEARAFVAKENKKKGIEKSLTELTWNRGGEEKTTA